MNTLRLFVVGFVPPLTVIHSDERAALIMAANYVEECRQDGFRPEGSFSVNELKVELSPNETVPRIVTILVPGRASTR